ncbi:hypothetical protein E1263_37435 [Kribbella antibiotica]|uniref:Uncharacterized protein n=1 Tax=Kribbella antibiotica TaxID=190195 RepID=A0A4R4YM24_9ACTN|nr:hypothetical protein [Kribbella antibiotica]TDD46006.1 hypothetical protein E1263_37435 [Kribbella antibiotica]
MSLLQFIAELATEEYRLNPADSLQETRDNTWLLSCSEDERAKLTVAEVVGAYKLCVAALRTRFAAEGLLTPAVFYVWHDEQAGQLRSSITSLPPDKLLFGATVRQAQLEHVVGDLLNAASFIAWSELEVTDEPTEDDDREYFVDVWHTFVA